MTACGRCPKWSEIPALHGMYMVVHHNLSAYFLVYTIYGKPFAQFSDQGTGICMPGCDGRDRPPCSASGRHTWQTCVLTLHSNPIRVGRGSQARGGVSGSWIWAGIIMSQRAQLFLRRWQQICQANTHWYTHGLSCLQHPSVAALRPSSTSARSDLGITAHEPRTMASPTQESSSQYGHRLSGRLCLCGGNPSRMCRPS